MRARWRSGALKHWLLARLLRMRRLEPALSPRAGYRPLPVRGPRRRHVVAWLREPARGSRKAAARPLLVVVTRLPWGLAPGHRDLTAPGERWGDTRIALPRPPRSPAGPRSAHPREARELLGARTVTLARDGSLPVRTALAELPVAVLAWPPEGSG